VQNQTLLTPAVEKPRNFKGSKQHLNVARVTSRSIFLIFAMVNRFRWVENTYVWHDDVLPARM